MNNRLRLSLFILGGLCLLNFAWHLWSGWRLVTIDANKLPLSTVIASIQKQGGIRLRTNLPPDTAVTMHVRKVPLLHALEVLAASTDSSWNVSYFTAPDKGSIESALATLSAGQQPEGWHRFALPGTGMRGIGAEFEQGVADPRTDPWKPKPATEANLHAYLQQAALMTSAQFWAPEQWNPPVARPPKEAPVQKALPSLATSVHGSSAEVFFLRGRPQRDLAETGQENSNRDFASSTPDRTNRSGLPPEEVRKAMEERTLAQINRLPKDERTAALAELEARKKFFEELAQLSPEERRAKMAERMEQAMSNGETVARMEAGSMKRSAMQTADQRNERYRNYLNHKREVTN